ncbi:MAG TPA: methyl-accepting chemotaxis protein, partial [Candidatus Wallbacteria bacterium]|nr:methyl-accepting chemotaxis protein [Candidatus Wallbacteria bacterium]
AAKETAEMIESSIKKAAAGAKIAQDTSQSLETIVSGSAKVTDLIGEIAAAAHEQERSVTQVNQGLAQIDNVTQQNTATAEEAAAASEELSSQAAELKGMLARFNLRKSGAQLKRMLKNPNI